MNIIANNLCLYIGISNILKDIRETKKMSLGIVRVKKKHKTMEHKVSFAFGMQKSFSKSILKQRPMKRVASNKKITFSENNETISYIKDE